uniref:BTB domain-containing protein n=1 Tax=Oryza meridionalis TaxID=40149 RepID=A0A0E0DU18_9ORYZ
MATQDYDYLKPNYSVLADEAVLKCRRLVRRRVSRTTLTGVAELLQVHREGSLGEVEVYEERFLHLRCDVVVVVNDDTAAPQSLVVANKPPRLPDLHHHLGELLIRAGKDADAAFEVRRGGGGGERFAAHRCVLAARSKVFKAELFGAMKEGDAACVVVRIDDMEPQVFRALLFFVYTDSLPEMRKEEEEAMCQRLLVAAEVYGMERLKLICESKLCKYIDVGTVASIMALADQYHCRGLMKACFDFVSFPDNLMAVLATDGFYHLSRSCPFITEELIGML